VRYRFHPLYQRIDKDRAAVIQAKTGRMPRTFVERLAPKTRAALRGVAYLNDASGFVVADDGAGKALLLTNEHVVRAGLPSGYGFFFFDGARATVSRVLTSDPRLDYALVEVALAPGASRAMSVEPNGLRADRPIYALAGYANLAFRNGDGELTNRSLRRAVAGLREARKTIEQGWVNQYALALGRVDHDASVREIPILDHSIAGVEANLPNSPGMSGSPVLARDTHAVVGLHSSGMKDAWWLETSIPIESILGDAKQKLASGVLDPAAADQISAWVRSAP
jgi:hypothetical protein